MLSVQLSFYCTSKEIQAKGASSFKYQTALHRSILKWLWNAMKKIVQENSTVLTQLKLSFQYRTSRWNGKPKDVDETHLVSEMHCLNFFLSNCYKKIRQMTAGYHLLLWLCQTFDIWYYVTSLVFNPFCPLLSTQVWILF